jgi:hypothetical protein
MLVEVSADYGSWNARPQYMRYQNVWEEAVCDVAESCSTAQSGSTDSSDRQTKKVAISRAAPQKRRGR